MNFGGNGPSIVVEPAKTAWGGTGWNIKKDGFNVGRHNYKDEAVSEARRLAKREGGSLRILNKNMNVQAEHSY